MELKHPSEAKTSFKRKTALWKQTTIFRRYLKCLRMILTRTATITTNQATAQTAARIRTITRKTIRTITRRTTRTIIRKTIRTTISRLCADKRTLQSVLFAWKRNHSPASLLWTDQDSNVTALSLYSRRNSTRLKNTSPSADVFQRVPFRILICPQEGGWTVMKSSGSLKKFLELFFLIPYTFYRINSRKTAVEKRVNA